MAFVVNNRVKMNWEQSGWLQTSGRGGKSVFIMSTQGYSSDNAKYGHLDVFFKPGTAFLYISDVDTPSEDVWNREELISTIKENKPGDNFPYMFEEYIPLTDDAGVCSAELLAKFGLSAHKADIEARLQDIDCYGQEYDVPMG